MPALTKFRLLPAILLLATPAFAATDSCFNVGTPSGGFVNITCNLYYNSPNVNPINLFPLMTQDGAPLANNDFVSNYTVIINGNPATLADNATGLFNTSLWEAVIFYPPGDPDGAIFSDALDVYFPGDFPSAATVQSYNASIFGSLPGFADSDFFLPATGSETVIGGGTDDVINVFTAASPTPEPSSALLMSTGILGVGLLAAMTRRREALLGRSS